MTAEGGGIAEESGDGQRRSVLIARNGGSRPYGTQFCGPPATHRRGWGIENRLVEASRRVRILEIADGGRQQETIWEIPDQNDPDFKAQVDRSVKLLEVYTNSQLTGEALKNHLKENFYKTAEGVEPGGTHDDYAPRK